MLIGSHQRLALVDSLTVRAGDTVLSRVYQFKYLAVMLDPYLSRNDNLRSGSIFVSLLKLHSGGQGETKREPDTNLLRNVCRPLF